MNLRKSIIFPFTLFFVALGTFIIFTIQGHPLAALAQIVIMFANAVWLHSEYSLSFPPKDEGDGTSYDN